MALVAHYKLNELTGTSGANSIVDSSTNNYHGEPAAAVVSATGKRQSAVYFDGAADFIEVADNANFDLTGDSTIAFWAYVDSDTPANSFFISKEQDSSGDGWAMNKVGSTVVLRINEAPTAVTCALAFGEWHHYAVTLDTGGNDTIYLDGVAVDSDAHVTVIANALAVVMGSRDDAEKGAGSFLKGQLDDVRIYNEVLSASQIRGIVSTGGYRARYMAGVVGNLIQWFRTRY